MKDLRIALDIDGTICNNTNGKYEEAQPYQHMIELVNELYDDGHYIIFHTARGMGYCNGVPNQAATKWYKLTQNQLDEWGVKYNELHLGKILADVYIDDRGFRIKDDGSSVEDLRRFLAG
jgi:uncharacterized HAD superfamily protein